MKLYRFGFECRDVPEGVTIADGLIIPDSGRLGNHGSALVRHQKQFVKPSILESHGLQLDNYHYNLLQGLDSQASNSTRHRGFANRYNCPGAGETWTITHVRMQYAYMNSNGSALNMSIVKPASSSSNLDSTTWDITPITTPGSYTVTGAMDRWIDAALPSPITLQQYETIALGSDVCSSQGGSTPPKVWSWMKAARVPGAKGIADYTAMDYSYTATTLSLSDDLSYPIVLLRKSPSYTSTTDNVQSSVVLSLNNESTIFGSFYSLGSSIEFPCTLAKIGSVEFIAQSSTSIAIVVNGTSTSTTTVASISSGWHFIEFAVNLNASGNSVASFSIDSQTVITDSGTPTPTTTSAMGMVIKGFKAATSMLDDIAINNSSGSLDNSAPGKTNCVSAVITAVPTNDMSLTEEIQPEIIKVSHSQDQYNSTFLSGSVTINAFQLFCPVDRLVYVPAYAALDNKLYTMDLMPSTPPSDTILNEFGFNVRMPKTYTVSGLESVNSNYYKKPIWVSSIMKVVIWSTGTFYVFDPWDGSSSSRTGGQSTANGFDGVEYIPAIDRIVSFNNYTSGASGPNKVIFTNPHDWSEQEITVPKDYIYKSLYVPTTDRLWLFHTSLVTEINPRTMQITNYFTNITYTLPRSGAAMMPSQPQYIPSIDRIITRSNSWSSVGPNEAICKFYKPDGTTDTTRKIQYFPVDNNGTRIYTTGYWTSDNNGNAWAVYVPAWDRILVGSGSLGCTPLYLFNPSDTIPGGKTVTSPVCNFMSDSGQGNCFCPRMYDSLSGRLIASIMIGTGSGTWNYSFDRRMLLLIQRASGTSTIENAGNIHSMGYHKYKAADVNSYLAASISTAPIASASAIPSAINISTKVAGTTSLDLGINNGSYIKVGTSTKPCTEYKSHTRSVLYKNNDIAQGSMDLSYVNALSIYAKSNAT